MGALFGRSRCSFVVAEEVAAADVVTHPTRTDIVEAAAVPLGRVVLERFERETHRRLMMFNRRNLSLYIHHGSDYASENGQKCFPVVVFVENYKEFEALCVEHEFSIIRYEPMYWVWCEGRNTCWRYKVTSSLIDSVIVIPTILYVGAYRPNARFVWEDHETVSFEWGVSEKLELPRCEAKDDSEVQMGVAVV